MNVQLRDFLARHAAAIRHVHRDGQGFVLV